MKTTTDEAALPPTTGSPSSEIPTPPEGWIYAGYGPIKHRPDGDDHSFDVAMFEYGKWQTSFARIGHGQAHYAVRAGSKIAAANGLVPLCASCGQPATCHGQYEDQPEGYACSDCCGHWCEDGQCRFLENAALSGGDRERPSANTENDL